MTLHDLRHIVVLGTTLLAAAAAAILLLAPLAFDSPPPGLARAKPFIWGLIALAGLLLASEWLTGH